MSDREDTTTSLDEVDQDAAEVDASPLMAPEPSEPSDSRESPEVDGSAETSEPSEAAESAASPQSSGSPADAGAARPTKVDRLEAEGDIAADYLEELLDIADLDGDLDIDVEGDRAAVSIVGADLQQLVGGNGEVLDALQELTRLVVYRETGERSRLMLDISGYRAARRAELERLATETVAQVRASGDKISLSAMSPFERKVVHDVVADAGLQSESEGAEPRRFVVVLPA